MGSDANWPGLGFNPAKGELHTVQSLAYDVKSVGDELDDLHRLLTDIGRTDGVWEGQAAQGFSRKLGELPRYLKQGTQSMHDCAKALNTWHTQLTDFQQRARALESDAVEARARVAAKTAANDRVNDRINQINLSGRLLTEAEAAQLREESSSAVSAANAAVDALDKIIDQAEKLQANWKDRAGEAERAILKASENHPPDLHWWDRALDGLTGAWRDFKDWLVENADLLSTISSALAAAALAMQFIPVIGQAAGAVLGTASVICAAGALAGHWMGNARGNGTPAWKIGLDALGVMPGVGAGVKGFLSFGKAAKAAAGTGRLARMMEGGMEGLNNPLSMKMANKVAGMFGKEINTVGTQLVMKTGSALHGAYKWATGGDEGRAPAAAPAAPATPTARADVSIQPYPATSRPFHSALAA
ncbi:hypothetical protein [Actinacidiphila sp. bgisy160]|uniref:hypothetical protein n=1 Tax=Actinacidiphila sp. bgisy160 TaxID=3413796 RepID=UPI003D72418F